MTTVDHSRARDRGPAPTYAIDFWRRALAAPAIIGLGPYGPLGPPDIYGIRLPAGFRARLIGRTGRLVAGSDYAWHGEPAGGATVRTKDGGWVYVSNSDLPAQHGGAGAIRFNAEGRVVDAHPILDGTSDNGAGVVTPWLSWLSCERFGQGRVWECDPLKPGQGAVRPGLGIFAHASAAVDPGTGWVYLTEDDYDGRVYRFRPDEFGDLSTGTLEAAKLRRSGHVDWVEVSGRRPDRSEATTGFQRSDVAWFAAGHLFFATASDHRVWAVNVATNEIAVIYDAAAAGPDAPFRRPVSITVHELSGDILVAGGAGDAGDAGAHRSDDLQLVLLADATRRRVSAPFLQLVGHGGSEITGVAFSPDASRLYFSSQRGTDNEGLTFEVVGPFRRGRGV